MILKRWQLKLMLNGFPPLFFSRVRITRISEGYREIDVKVGRSLLNRNFQGTIFGGTIFSAADPYYALMYWQIFQRAGVECEAWLKAAEIDYKKPAASNLILKFRLSEEEVNEAIKTVNEEGRFKKWHTINAVDKEGDICAEIKTLVYLRKPKKYLNKSTSNF